jgi:hypothetical protein
MDCPHCGLGNRPYLQLCWNCNLEIQDALSAAAKKTEWDALPESVRAEYEKELTRIRRGAADHLTWARSHRKTTMAAGAFLFMIGMQICSPSLLFWPIDLALGGAATWKLYHDRGGRYWGLLYFMIAFAIASILHGGTVWALGGGGGFAAVGGVLSWITGTLIVETSGYYLGLKLDMEHTDHSMQA